MKKRIKFVVFDIGGVLCNSFLIDCFEFIENKELIDFALKLKNKGYKIAILSNRSTLSKRIVLKFTRVNLFDFVMMSCDVGVKKPKPEIYELFLRKTGVRPKKIVFIDDKKRNIIPARKLGMNTILFVNNGQTIGELSKLGVHI